MKAISLRAVAAFCVLLVISCTLGGCGGGSSTPPPCTTNCPPAAKPEFLYASGINQIQTFTVNPSTGALSGQQTITGPNQAPGIVATPSGNFLYVSDFSANAVDVFSINATTGALTQIQGSPFSVGTAPGAGGLAIDPAGKFLYVTQLNAAAVAAFTINASTGALTAAQGSSFPASTTPVLATVDATGKFLYVSNNGDAQGGISAYQIALQPARSRRWPVHLFPPNRLEAPQVSLHLPMANFFTWPW